MWMLKMRIFINYNWTGWMDKVIKALREASVSVACGLDDGVLYRKDIEHIQKQITIIENFLEPFAVEELTEMSKK